MPTPFPALCTSHRFLVGFLRQGVCKFLALRRAHPHRRQSLCNWHGPRWHQFRFRREFRVPCKLWLWKRLGLHHRCHERRVYTHRGQSLCDRCKSIFGLGRYRRAAAHRLPRVLGLLAHPGASPASPRVRRLEPSDHDNRLGSSRCPAQTLPCRRPLSSALPAAPAGAALKRAAALWETVDRARTTVHGPN